MSSLSLSMFGALSAAIAFAYNYAYFSKIGPEFLGLLSVQDMLMSFASSGFWAILGLLTGEATNYLRPDQRPIFADGNTIFAPDVLARRRYILSIISLAGLVLSGALFAVIQQFGRALALLFFLSGSMFWFSIRVPLLRDIGILEGLKNFERAILDSGPFYILVAMLLGYQLAHTDTKKSTPVFVAFLQSEQRVELVPLKLIQSGIIAKAGEHHSVTYIPWTQIRELLVIAEK